MADSKKRENAYLRDTQWKTVQFRLTVCAARNKRKERIFSQSKCFYGCKKMKENDNFSRRKNEEVNFFHHPPDVAYVRRGGGGEIFRIPPPFLLPSYTNSELDWRGCCVGLPAGCSCTNKAKPNKKGRKSNIERAKQRPDFPSFA